MVESKLNNIPGFYKIFDEVIVNAWGQYVRMKDTKEAVKNIDVIVDKSSGLISVKNDGKGIDIATDTNQFVLFSGRCRKDGWQYCEDLG